VKGLAIADAAKAQVLRELLAAVKHLKDARDQGSNVDGDLVKKAVADISRRAQRQAVGEIVPPPKYISADFLSGDFWRLRGKLDVPKERWVSFPCCEARDGTLAIAWAGYDHLQLARAIGERYELAKQEEGRKLIPLLTCWGHLIPWLKQWHNALDPAFGVRMGDYFEGELAREAKLADLSVAEVMAWTPPEQPRRTRRRRSDEGA